MRKPLSRLSIVVALVVVAFGCVPSAKGLRGDHFFERGEYRLATHAYQDALKTNSSTAQPDRLLLRLSLTYLLSSESASGAETRALGRANAGV